MSVTAKLESTIETIVSKFIPKRVFDKPLPEQVRVARKMANMLGMAPVRRGLLKDGGIPGDIGDMLKKGMSREEIKAYYWGCKEFRDFWEAMEMSEDTLDVLIDDTIAKLNHRLLKKAAKTG